MQQSNPKKDNGSGRGMKILFGLSLALNLAVIGIVAGSFLRPEGAGHRLSKSPGMSAFGAPYVLALPKEDRRAVFQILRKAPREEVPNRQMRREMFRDVLVSLRATPFDADALESAVSRQAESSVSVQSRAQRAWLDVVEAMTDAERADYAAKVEDLLSRGPKRR